MKLFRNLLDGIKPQFEEGGKLHKYYPAYDAIETFLFVPGHTTHSGSHIRDGIDLKRTMIMVVLAMVPALLFGIWNTGHQHALAIGEMTGMGEDFLGKFLYGSFKVLPIVIVSYATGLGVEFLFAIIRKEQVNEGFLVSGMLIPLVMPVEVPLWMVGLATIFAVVIGKEVFGGTGMNILNVALTARAFLFFAYPTMMSGNKVWVPAELEGTQALADGFTGATALGDLAELSELERGTEAAGTIWQTFQAGGTYDFMSSFLGFIPGSIGETSALACLIGAGILLFTGIASWRVMVSMLIGGLTMGLLFNLWGGNMFMDIPPHHQLVIGGFMFGMVFMATDPVTAAQTNTGKLIYGFGCGFFGIMIRVFNPAYPEGIMLAILFMNVMAPFIDHYVVQANVNRRLKRIKVA